MIEYCANFRGINKKKIDRFPYKISGNFNLYLEIVIQIAPTRKNFE